MRKNKLPRYSMSLLALVAVMSPLGIHAEARFASLKGTVQIYQNQKWVDANLAMKLPTGAMIQTAYRSQAIVIYPKGGQLALGSNTRVTLLDNSVSSGTDREVLIDHGNVSGFVKKGTGAERNGFRMRTPTVVAGVRGSVLAGILAGKTLTVQAIQSAAEIARTDATQYAQTTNLALAQARTNLAQAQAGLERTNSIISRLESALQKARISGNPYDKIAAKSFEDALKTHRATLAKQSADLQARVAQERAAAANAASAKNYLDALAKEEAELIKIAQGDEATSSNDGIYGPIVRQNTSTRPATINSIGQTGTEKQFMKQNDVQVGIGSDTQQLYNTINTVTQPTNTGSPTLKKL